MSLVFQWFRDEVGQRQQETVDQHGGLGGLGLGPLAEEPLLSLFSHLDPIYEVHCTLLRELEHRMATW